MVHRSKRRLYLNLSIAGFTHSWKTFRRKARHDAWVLSGPPNFTWGIDSPTTLWDIVEDVYNKNSQSFVADPTAQFYRDIWPVLAGTYRISWTNKDALQGHGELPIYPITSTCR